jgi:AcrR family transcriptional regulator
MQANERSGGNKVPRKRGEARRLIVEAARELFAKQGYDGASIRDIARHAQVAESLVFRDFGTKQQLFEEAVLEPYHEFLASFMEKWREAGVELSNEEVVRRFVTEFYNVLSQHRELVMTPVNANIYSVASINVNGQDSALSKQLDTLDAFVGPQLEGRGLTAMNFPISIRCVTGMLMSLVLLDDWLFPHGRRHPSRRAIIDEVVEIVLRGATR